jgi:hypothetical protein
MSEQALKPLRTPEDYDISKTARLDLTDLEEKKALSPEVMKRIAFDLIIEHKIKLLAGNQYGLSLSINQVREENDKKKEK